MAYFETSAKDNTNVEQSFLEIARAALARDVHEDEFVTLSSCSVPSLLLSPSFHLLLLLTLSLLSIMKHCITP
jgi:hypothetical protein